MDTFNICMKEFGIFVCPDSTEIFSKLRSAVLNYNMLSFFTVRGVSNKHCLLTFFICLGLFGREIVFKILP